MEITYSSVRLRGCSCEGDKRDEDIEGEEKD